ncbi:MAG: DUF523 domain-containing protein [Peptococcaceae bacterium]|nr:DUF523 domain-containing protein [Peptococcaceae bacterium]
MILVSACLAGILCKYNGTYNNVPEIIQLVDRGLAIPVCPEVLGGGSVPREPNEIVGGDGYAVLDGKARVMTPSGVDCTGLFVRGAEKVLEIAEKNNVRVAVLKERSPSCGSSLIYDGTFSGRKIRGCGVTAAILRKAGIEVCSEENFSDQPGKIRKA